MCKNVPVVVFDQVSMLRGKSLILKGLSLSICAEVVALVGPSGSGKTSLLRALLGLESLSNGCIYLNNKRVSSAHRFHIPCEERHLAMVFQNLALWPHFTVYGNLEFGLKSQGIDVNIRKERIHRALAWCDLAKKASCYPHELSGGEQQRVAIARSLVLEPVAMLFDEPLSSLDIALKDELLTMFKSVYTKLNIPMLYVTHDPYDVAQIADRIVVIEQGSITADSLIHRFKDNAVTPFARAFAARLNHV